MPLQEPDADWKAIYYHYYEAGGHSVPLITESGTALQTRAHKERTSGTSLT